MARENLSPQAVRSMLEEQSGEVFLLTCKITGQGFSDILLVNNLENITVESETYIAFPFNIILPNESKDKPPLSRIRIDNLDPRIIQAIRSSRGKPTFELAVRLASTPDIVEVGPIILDSAGAEWDKDWVELVLASKNLLNEPWPFRTFSPTKFPGLFQ